MLFSNITFKNILLIENVNLNTKESPWIFEKFESEMFKTLSKSAENKEELTMFIESNKQPETCNWFVLTMALIKLDVEIKNEDLIKEITPR